MSPALVSKENNDELRTRVILHEDRVTGVSSSDFPHTWQNLDGAFSLSAFKDNLKVVITDTPDKDTLEFDLIGVDASIANAFRRILISEVPTMAIESVFIFNNTSIIHDEILAQRLGLVPILADAREFEFKMGSQDDPTDLNTLVFRLDVKCSHNPASNQSHVDPEEKYINSSVYSRDLVWVPQGDQAEKYQSCPIRPIHDDILIAKLRPGQHIHLEMHCQKGIGTKRNNPQAKSTRNGLRLQQPHTDSSPK